jgi:tetratricopeptide (TPR) repeat protein
MMGQSFRVGLLAVAVAAAAPGHAQDKPKPASATSGARDRSKADDAAAAEAAKARSEREARVPQVVQEAERPKVATQNEPTLAYETFRRRVELQMAKKRRELIAQLDDILKENPPEAEKPELLFQKAELFLEEAQFHFFEGMGQDDAIADASNAGNDAKVAQLMEKREKEVTVSKKWGKDALDIFGLIEKKYPKFERMADVLYSMGQAHWDAQNYKESLRVYRRLIKDFPKSQYIPDAWLAFGEYYFQVAPDADRDVKKALDAYIEAAKKQESQVFGYATYKQGWCYYNLTRHDKAAEKFKEVILYSQLNSDILGNRRIGLASEARKDYVLAYSHYGTAAEAPAEFKQVADGEEHRKMLERLADLYYGDGKDREAIITYQWLMKADPANTKNPLYQGKIVKLASRIGEKRQVVGQSRKLVDEYRRVRGVFQNMKESDPKRDMVGEDLRAADEVSDNTLRFLATTWHNEAKKTLDNPTFEYAYELYGDYLSLFPDRKESYEIRFFYAELLYRLEKFEQAGEQYIKVFLADKNGKWAEASAEEAVRAYEEVVKDYDKTHKIEAVAGADALKEKPIPEIKKKYIAACNNYLQAYPKGKIVIEAKYKVARTLYDFNVFKDSTPRFTDIVDNHGDHPRGIQSANLVLDTYNILEDWQKLNDAARSFYANKSLAKNKDYPEFRDVLAKVLEESSFKLISTFEKKKQWEEAGKRYLAFGEEFPKSALADKAFANAAAMFTRAGQLDRAIKVRIKLVNEFNKSPLVPDQMYSIATTYEQIVAYKDAAAWLEKFVVDFPKEPRAKDALYNASIYRQGTGDPKKAVEDREQYLKTFANAPDAEDVAYSIAVCWEESGSTKKAIEAYNDFAAKWRKKDPARALNAQYKAQRLLEKTKASKTEVERSMRDLETASQQYRRSGKSIEEVGDPLAIVAFRNADEVFQRFKELKIAKPDNPSEFKKTLSQKREGKDSVYKAYTEVVKLKSPEWAVASLFRIGEAIAHLVKAISDVPAPRGLTDEQQDLFKGKLTEQTLPLEDQAVEAMQLCLAESARFGVFNEWTRRCLSYLEENRPQTYPKNAIEVRSPIVVQQRQPERGVGLVLELPTTGTSPKPTSGTEPPPAPFTQEKVSLGGPKKEKQAEPMDFEAEGGGG